MTVAAALAVPLLLAAAAAAPDPPQRASDEDALAQMSLSLSGTSPYRFVLAYHGAPRPFRGWLCYGFAGYNETCVRPRLEWLTPATRIELYAPGGVPRELLEGYVMLVRYPALSDRTFSYRLER